MWSDSFEEVDLRVLFPRAAAADLDRMHRTATGLDRVRPDPARVGWGHSPGNVGPAAGDSVLSVLCTAVPLVVEDQDWLELGLFVGYRDGGSLLVTASIDVCCQCPQDHNVHEVEEVRWVAGTSGELADSFEAAAKTVVGWFGIPRDPAHWRARAGLPSSSVQ